MKAYKTDIWRDVLVRTDGSVESVKQCDRVSVWIIYPDGVVPDAQQEWKGFDAPKEDPPLRICGSWMLSSMNHVPASVDILDLPEVDKELARWQDTIRNELMSAMGDLPEEFRREIDGSGADSGDPLDLTLSEVRQAIGAFVDAIAAINAKGKP